MKSAEFGYRPCITNNRKALFHRWFEYSVVTLRFTYPQNKEAEKQILNTWQQSGVLPYSVEPQTATTLQGLVEFEDGTIERVCPSDIRFLDTKEQMDNLEL